MTKALTNYVGMLCWSQFVDGSLKHLFRRRAMILWWLILAGGIVLGFFGIRGPESKNSFLFRMIGGVLTGLSISQIFF
jgi:hypothetical protein